jgi:hypothetical protein
VIEDGWCGEPIGWGFRITRHLGEERFRELAKFGNLECLSSSGQWVVMTRKLTREEAAQKYGEITNEEFGPRGGWRSVTFGDKKFINDLYETGEEVRDLQ